LQVSLLTYRPSKERLSLRTPRAFIALAALAVAVAVVSTSVVSATAQDPALRDPTQPCPGATNPLPGETCGDHYLESVRISLAPLIGNEDLLGFPDNVDTSKATTQSDLFKPGGNRVGPREPTSCNGTPYGKTIWYDINPPADGELVVGTGGGSFNPVIALVRYDVSDQPNFRPVSGFKCFNGDASTSETVTNEVLRWRRGYSLQIGGVGNTGGPFKVDFNFKPYRVSATPKLAFQLTPRGVRLLNVLVKSSRKARVEVSCKGCGKRVKRGRRVSLNFRKALRAGSKLTIRVTRGGEIGAYFSYKIRKGKRPVETQRCLNPGSKKPRKRCP